jgi:DNA-binding Xre family transcriptional regulator
MKDMLCLGISENSVNSNVSGSPEKFVVARQKQKDLELSHLQELCNELICELEQLDSQSG